MTIYTTATGTTNEVGPLRRVVNSFNEVQAKTRDLTEALTYQTGSGNILRVIASSPTDVIPVLQAQGDDLARPDPQDGSIKPDLAGRERRERCQRLSTNPGAGAPVCPHRMQA